MPGGRFLLSGKGRRMRTVSILLLTFLLAVGCLAQGDKGKITPTPDPNAPFKVYIPKDLDDAFVELQKMLSPALLDEIRLKSEKEMITYHHGFGTWLRNYWGLWAGSRLAQYFNQLGINHPDDMSGTILTSFWRHLHAQPIGLEEQVQSYKEYWSEANEKEEAITPVSVSVLNHPLRAYDGGPIKLEDYAGKKVVVLAWWYMLCKPSDADCELLTHLVKLKRDYGDKGVEVIGMPGIYPFNADREAKRVKSLTSKYGVNFPLVWDDDTFTHDVEEYEKFGYSSIPQVFVISRDGYVVKRIRGFDSQSAPGVLRGAVEGAIRSASRGQAGNP